MNAWKTTLAVIWLAAGETCYGAASHLTIVLLDFADTPRWILEPAVENARHIFQLSGVETAWGICQGPADHTPQCFLPPPGTYMQVRILADQFGRPTRPEKRLAYAPQCSPAQGCSIAYVGLLLQELIETH